MDLLMVGVSLEAGQGVEEAVRVGLHWSPRAGHYG